MSASSIAEHWNHGSALYSDDISVNSSPTFRILSLTDSLVNLRRSGYWGFHHTLCMLPHYFVKYLGPYTTVFKRTGIQGSNSRAKWLSIGTVSQAYNIIRKIQCSRLEWTVLTASEFHRRSSGTVAIFDCCRLLQRLPDMHTVWGFLPG